MAHFILQFSRAFDVDSPDWSVLETAPKTVPPSGLLPHISAERSLGSHQSAEASRQVTSQILFFFHGQFTQACRIPCQLGIRLLLLLFL